jgi:hypothetical protein
MLSSLSRAFGFLLLGLTAACGRTELDVASEFSAGTAGTGALPRPAAASCGDAVIDEGEQCDDTALGSATCAAFGFSRGRLRCDRSCHYDTSGCSLETPAKPACPEPDAPVALPAGCAQALCACDRAAFTQCNFNCWARVACRVATCNNNPMHRDCALGCPQSSMDEISLGQCYEDSTVCTRR